VKNQHPDSIGRNRIAGFAAVLFLLTSGSVQGQETCAIPNASTSSQGEVGLALARFGSRLVAVGRVDAATPDGEIEVLGQRVQAISGESFQIGDYAAIVDWSRNGSREQLLEAHALATRYVPGASEVYLRSKVAAADTLRGRVKLGSVYVDYTTTSLAIRPTAGLRDSVVEIRGTQPSPRGTVLGICATATLETTVASRRGRSEGSLGTGRPDGSLGTGRPDGSLGTGRPDGSLGTGRPDGSLGTGRPDGSLGTGSPDGSLGTGRPDGSLGTGRPDGSLGTGRPDGSLGTGRPDGSLGTGRPDGSLGTGRPDGSLGTGSPDGSLGTGRPDGSLGTGRPDGSLGTGSPDGSLGTGSPDGSLGTGRPDGSLGTGSPDGSLGTGSPDGSLGTGSPEGSLGTGSPD